MIDEKRAMSVPCSHGLKKGLLIEGETFLFPFEITRESQCQWLQFQTLGRIRLTIYYFYKQQRTDSLITIFVELTQNIEYLLSNVMK